MHPARRPTPSRQEEIEENYFVYRQSLRILMREDAGIEHVKRTFCWQRLMGLHLFQPCHYPDPHHLYWQFKLDLAS